jgi:hypothetical protein
MVNLVKQDINFCEYPIWFQNPEQSEGLVWKDQKGYIYRAGFKAPTKSDVIFLYYLMLQIQKGNWKDTILTTPYRIIVDCGLAKSKYWRERLRESLKRWENVRIEFNGLFYNGIEYQTLSFGIIDSWGIEEKTKKLWIRFSLEWLLKIKESNFFKYLDFEQIKTLRSPVAIRLYEILIKSFQGRDVWEIDALKLAAKIPMAEKYVSDVIPKIKAAVNRINDKTSIELTLRVRRPKRGQAIFVFRKQKALDDKRKEQSQVIDVLNDSEAEDYRDLLNLLPKQHQIKKTIQEMITRYLHKCGSEYVRRNVLYTNDQVRDPKKYRVYFAKALKEDWGLGWEEDQNSKLAGIKIEPGQIVTFRGKEHEVQEGNCLHLEDGIVPEGELRRSLLGSL